MNEARPKRVECWHLYRGDVLLAWAFCEERRDGLAEVFGDGVRIEFGRMRRPKPFQRRAEYRS